MATKNIVDHINGSADINATALAFLLDSPAFVLYEKYPDILLEITGHYPDFTLRDREKFLT